jgi:methylthioribose-1-phosphate isomerase
MTVAQSPLFEPVVWRGRGFEILDELQLPARIHYIPITEAEQAIDAVRQMKTRAFGQVLTFLYSGALVAQAYSGAEVTPLRACLARMTEQFCAARPTFDFRGLGAHFETWCRQLPDGVNVGETIARRARDFGQQIVCGRAARAKRAAGILPNPARVLTHCNVSGELVAIAKHCTALGKSISVIATETRPYLQGARLTAWELAEAGVPVSLIPDCAIAQVMARGELNAAIVGADRTARNGDIINKVGTYPIARLAREYGVPFYALVQDPRSLERGADVPIEERPADELIIYHGEPLVAGSSTALRARYPAFDMTPAALITRLIGFDDLYTPEAFRQKYHGELDGGDLQPAAGSKYLLVYGIPSEGQYELLANALQGEHAESVLVPEMRPNLWGGRLVAPELLRRNVPTTYVSDNMLGALFAAGEIHKLYLFYTAPSESGFKAICGSLLAAQLARLHGVPAEFIDGDQNNYSTPDTDVSTFLGKKIIPAGVEIRPLDAEVIPWNLFATNP